MLVHSAESVLARAFRESTGQVLVRCGTSRDVTCLLWRSGQIEEDGPDGRHQKEDEDGCQDQEYCVPRADRQYWFTFCHRITHFFRIEFAISDLLLNPCQ